MDAAHKLLTKTALLLATALLIAVPASAQQLSVSSNTVGLNDNQAKFITVAASGTNPVTYTVTGVPFWLNAFSSNNHTTPDTLYFQLLNTNCGTIPCTASVTLSATGSTPITVTVTYAPGTGGGAGTLIANPSTLTFSALSGQAASPQNVSLTTATSSVGISSIGSDQPSWLSAQITSGSFTVTPGSPATLTVSASAATLVNNSYTGHITITPSVGTATTITVTFNVGTGGGTTGTIVATPASLTFSAQPGSVSAAQTVSLASTTAGTTLSNITSDLNPNWISVSGIQAGATMPATMQVSASAAALPTGTYTGHLTLIPNIGTPSVITVTFNVGTGTGGGTGTITASQTSYSFAYPSNTLTGVLTVGSSNPAVANFNVNVTSQSNWLLFQGVAGSFTGVGFGSFTISVNTTVAATLATGAYSGTIVLINPQNVNDTNTINLTLTVNGGTGTGGGTLSVSQTNLPFTAAPGGLSQSQNLTVNVASNATVALNAHTNNLPAFFSITSPACNGTPNQDFSCTFTGSQNLTITVNPANLVTQGPYTGFLQFQSGGSTVQVNVTLNLTTVTTLTVSPTSLAFSAAAGGASQTQGVTVAVPNSASVQATLTSSSGNFFSVTVPNACNSNPTTNPTCTFTGDQTLSVTVNPAVLTNQGTYTGNIQLVSGGVSSNVTVSLTLTGTGTGGGTTSAIAAPASLAFAYQTASATAPSQQVITVGPVGTFSATATVQTTQQWLNISTVGSTGPGYVIVSVTPQGLPVGTYQGTITITSASGSLSIPVTLTVTTAVVVQSSPANIYLQYQAGTGTVTQGITLVASDNSSTPASVSTSTPWITIGTPSSANTPVSLNLTLNPSGLCNGLNTGSVTVSAPNAANNGFTIPVVVLVSGSTVTTGCTTGGTGPLTLGASVLTFTAQVNGALPGAQNLTVVPPTSATSYTVTYGVQSGGFNWLVVQPSGTLVGTQNLVVSVNQTGLALGTYTGTISFNTNGQVQTVQVNLTVNTTGGGGVLNASPTSLSFTYSPGAPATTPASQTLAVTSTSGATGVSFAYLVTGNVPFTATVNGTTIANGQTLATPANIVITPSVTGLVAGATYSGTITLSPSSGAATTVPVTLTVSAAPTVSASPTTLTFTYNAGSAAPSPQTVQVTGGSGLTFTATASSAGNWLAVSPAAGTTPGSLSVSVNPAGLTANTYTGTVTVTGTGGATGTTTINVTLTVNAPLPTITSVGSAASYVGGSISPGEIITIFGTSIGPTPGVTLALDPATGRVATTLGGVQVLVNGFLSPMVFASNTQVSAVVPYEICASSCGPGTIAQVIVKFLGQSSNGIPTQVVSTTPAIFTANASGSGPGAILNANLSVNSPANPANKGDIVAIYMTGEGLTSPAGVTGKVTTVSPTGPLTPVPLLPVSVLIDGQPAGPASFFGEAPGLVSGVMQLNVPIPANARSGALSLVVSIGGASSQQGVTVSVR